MKNNILTAMLFFCAVLFGTLGVAGCGCGTKTSIKFNCDSELVLVVNSLDSSTADAKLLSNEDITNVDLYYDSDVIEYNISTGRIVAVGEGETILRAKLGGAEAIVSVKVLKNYFCTNFEIRQNAAYLLRENGANPVPFNLLEKLKSDFESLQNYNMGYNFSVLEGQDVVRVDSTTGVVTPLKSGQAKIAITVVSGIKNGEYTYKTEYITIDVKAPCTELNMDILYQDGTALDYETENDGYVRKYVLDKNTWYAVRISSDSQIFYGNNALINETYYAYADMVTPLQERECINIDGSLSSSLNNHSTDKTSETYTFYPLRDFCWQTVYTDAAQNSGESVGSIILKVHLVDLSESVDVATSIVPYITDSEDLRSNVIVIDEDLTDYYMEFEVQGDNLADNIVICEPSEYATAEYDFTKSNIVRVYPKEYDKIFTLTIKNKYNPNDELAFSQKYRIWQSWDNRAFTMVTPDNLVLLWNVEGHDYSRATLSELYSYGKPYTIKVFDSSKNIIDEWGRIFEIEVTVNDVCINVANTFTEADLGTYYVRLMVNEKICTNDICVLVQRADD